MSKSLIPLRPEGLISPLTQDEQSALTWMIISGCPRKDAVLIFAHPDMINSKAKAAVSEYIKQFFARKEVQDYIEAYQNTLDNFLHPAPVKKEPVGTIEERKAEARSKALEFAITLMDNIEQAKDQEFVFKMADKVGLLDGDEEVEEQPRRYLPQSCIDHCAYRMFCEENTEDMCQYCKYHKFGEDNGIHYEKDDILDVPPHSGTELAEE